MRTANGANALPQDRALTTSVETTSKASTEHVYRLLADLQTHLEWGGKRQHRKTALSSIDAPAGEATVGTEFASTGTDPMGVFRDRSVVTEAVPGRVFEFVTESALTTKKGGEPVAWTVVHRYELASTTEGSRIFYTARITRISHTPGVLRLLRTRLAPLVLKASASVARRGIKNLRALAEERAG